MFDGRLASQVDLVVVDVPGLFDRPGVYGERGEDYPDNAVRFAAFSRAAAELVRQRAATGRPVDIVHCNDWPTALVPTYLRALAAETPALAATRTVLTIHNVAHQGVFPRDVLPSLGLGWDAFRVDGIEFYGGINLLKQGIVTADAVTTVSPTYAREIQTAEHGAKLDGVLRDARRGARRDHQRRRLRRLEPGDRPGHRRPLRRGGPSPTGRAARARCRRSSGCLSTPRRRSSRTSGDSSSRRGPTLVAAALPRLLRGDRRAGRRRGRRRARRSSPAIEAGGGQGRTGASCSRARRASRSCTGSSPRPTSCWCRAATSRAGWSRCTRSATARCRWRDATGGLVDTIVDCDAKLETGTGFLFEEGTADALLGATERALAARTLPRWRALVRRVMRLDRGWERPARRYEQLYRSLAPR